MGGAPGVILLAPGALGPPASSGVMRMSSSSYLRENAERALRLARDNADPTAVKDLLRCAAQSWGRADAIDLLENLGKVAAALGDGKHCPRLEPAGKGSQLWLEVAGIEPAAGGEDTLIADCCAILLAGSASTRQ
jgi:hypothetical protein